MITIPEIEKGINIGSIPTVKEGEKDFVRSRSTKLLY